jgi:putative aldouronate transport system permease protein
MAAPTATPGLKKLRQMSKSDRIFYVVISIIGLFIFVITLFPIWFVVVASLSEPARVSGGSVWLWPAGFNLDGYREILKETRIWIGYRNTIAYTVVGTLFSLFVTLPSAYALSRKDFKLRTPLMIFFIITMYFSGGLIPTYILITNNLHMNNTFWVMVIPFCLNVYNMIVCRTYFASTIPQELLDASRIDGCTNLRFFITVVLPLSKAIVSVITLYYIIGKWNEYFNALIYINDSNRMTLQLVLREILLRNETATYVSESAIRMEMLMKYTSIVVSSLPVLILYPFLQKYFEKGVMIGSIKG